MRGALEQTDGRYAAPELIASTSIFEIHACTDTRFEREVWFKLLTSEAPEAREQFLREARLQAQLQHPAIVPVYDLGLDPAGRCFFTTRRPSGRTLRSVIEALERGDLDTKKSFSRNKLLSVFRRLCLAVDYVHSRGISHRALSPEHVVVGEFGEVTLIGWHSATVDASATADVHSLKAMLLELLALEASAPGDPCDAATLVDPNQRTGTARALHDAVDRFLTADRDREQRQTLSLRHAEVAEQSALAAIRTESHVERRTALSEIGKALALDPGCEQARQTLARLLASPPAELPAEARAALDTDEARETARVGRFAVVAYCIFALLLGLIALGGIRSGLGFSLLVGAVLATIASGAWLAGSRRAGRGVALAVTITSSLAIAFASGLYGALVLVPALAVANTIALCAGVSRAVGWVAVGLGCASIAVPLALERFGIVPTAYIFARDTITILPVIREFPESAVRVSLLVVSLITVAAPALFVWRRRDELDRLRERLHIHGWRLARLLPLKPDARREPEA
jgi:eukaryotic-like serine/threonine-protein kinase